MPERKNSCAVSDAAAPLSTGYWTAADTLRLKGAAILMIVLHNFFHLVGPLPRENEFSFSHEYAAAFWSTWLDGPVDWIRCVFSFLGHFGVQLFIFLSAYGLTRKMINRPAAFGPFILSRYRKIYPVFLAAIACWLLKIAIFSGPAAAWDRLLSGDLLLAVLGLSNAVPGQALQPVGPWWFIGFIFQFYWLYPLLFRLAQKTGGKGLFALAAAGVLITVLFNDHLLRFNVSFYYTLIAHLPEICLGMYLAQHQRRISYLPLAAALAGIIFLLGTYWKSWWYVNHISALVLLLSADHLLQKVKWPSAERLMIFYGALSMPLFLVNAYLRHPLIDWAQKNPQSPMILVYAVLFLLLVTAAAGALQLLNVLWTRIQSAHARC